MVEKRENKHAVIYFTPGSAPAMKDLAAQIRGEGGRTTLIWSAKWRGPENLIPEARAIIIEKGCANADKIAAAYEKYGVDVEIHYVNSDGYGEEAADAAEEKTNPEPVRAEEASAPAEEAADPADSEESADDEPEDVSSDPVQDAEGDASGVDEEDRVEN